MKTLACALVALVLLGASGRAAEVRWLHDPAAARKEAAAKRLPLLLDFGNEDCIWCKRLDATTFRDDAVVRLVNERFVAVKVDTHRDVQLTQSLGVQGLPTLLVTSAEGKVLARNEGYLDVTGMLAFLRRVAPEPSEPPARSPTPSASSRTTLAPVDEDARRQNARRLLRQARQDRDDRCLVACLERCRLITTDYADLTEAAEARRLMASLSPDRSLAEMRVELAGLCLAQAAALEKEQRWTQAAACLEQALALAPDGPEARDARARLRAIRERLAQAP
jgi:thioredoxin-like negative regulator of GroEL